MITKKIITSDSCLLLNYHIIDENNILIQAFNNFDPYFDIITNQCKIKFNPISSIIIKEVMINGVDEIKSDLKKFLNEDLLISSFSDEYILKAQEFRLFLISFK